MFGLNLFALLAFLAVNWLALYLCRAEVKAREHALRVICLLLLCVNLFRYALFPLRGLGLVLPVEYSSYAYFIVPILFFSGFSWGQAWASYSGMMAGFFYYATMILSGGSIYQMNPPWDIYLSLFCHGALYLVGLVLVNTRQFKRQNALLFFGTIFVALRAHLLRPFAVSTGRLFIYELMEAAPLKALASAQAVPFLLPLYYALVGCLLLLSIKAFYALNRRPQKKRAKSAEQPQEVPFTPIAA